MKHIKLFETVAAFEEVHATLDLPNVSLTVDNNTVHYNPYIDPVTPVIQHDYVEIGGIKWATMNVGANSITDTGLYFQWGDTQGYTADQVGEGEGKKYFGWADYKYGNGTSDPGANGMTKYNSTDRKKVLEASDDAVVANWGGAWRMPTTEEFVALGDAVNYTWTDDYQGSGVSGTVLTDKTDSSKVLFFPTVGFCCEGNRWYEDRGFYWTSSLNPSKLQNSRYMTCSDGSVNWQFSNCRCYGCAVRGILDDSNS